MSMLFFKIALVCAAWGIVSAIAIVSYISRRGQKINYLLLRIMIYKYIHSYSEMTREERGRPGFWFYSYIVSMNLALVFVIIGAVLKA